MASGAFDFTKLARPNFSRCNSLLSHASAHVDCELALSTASSHRGVRLFDGFQRKVARVELCQDFWGRSDN